MPESVVIESGENLEEVKIKKRQPSVKNGMHTILNRLFFAEKEDDRKLAVSDLREKIKISKSATVDAVDEGGMSGRLTAKEKKEFKKPMFLFERILRILLLMKFKDMTPIDVVEMMLLNSELVYDESKNERILSLLKRYDQLEPRTSKYLQWKIFSGKAEMEVNESLKPISSEFGLLTKKINLDEGSKLCNYVFLDIFRAVFISGSLILLKHLLTQVKEKEITLLFLLNTAIYCSVSVKKENALKFKECFDYAQGRSDPKIHMRQVN